MAAWPSKCPVCDLFLGVDKTDSWWFTHAGHWIHESMEHGTNMSWQSLWASRRDSMSQNQPRGVTTSSVVSRGSLAWIFRTCMSLADKNTQKRNLDSFVSERSLGTASWSILLDDHVLLLSFGHCSFKNNHNLHKMHNNFWPMWTW